MNEHSVTDLLEHLRDGFLSDMPERVTKIEDEVMSSRDAGSYDELFRMVHSLKGSAGSYNFHEITRIAHGMEDVMLALMERNEFNKASTLDILLQFIDILRDTTESLISMENAPLDIDERLEVLRGQVFTEAFNVLVVEPSRLYASMIQYSLEGMSINFTFTQDGLQGLNNLLAQKYDLLITSLESSRLNGDALVAALRLVHNFNKHIKTILITSREVDKIANKDDFDAILDRKSIKDGKLTRIVKEMMAKN